MRRASLIASACVLTGATFLQAQVPDGPEFRVNSLTAYNQRAPSVGIDSAGNFVVVWQAYGDGSLTSIAAQRYDSAGAPLGGEVLVNSHTSGFQTSPRLARNSSGAFVVVWESAGQDGSQEGVFGQRFSSAGARIGGEFQVNVYTTGKQTKPQIAMDDLGGFVVVWQSPWQDGSYSGVFGRRFDGGGAPLGGEFQVNQFTQYDQKNPSVAMSGSGEFVVTWDSYQQGGQQFYDDVFARRFDGVGAPRGPEFRVNSYTNDTQYLSSVGMDDSGNFAVVWQGWNPLSGGTIAGRRYDSAGVLQGDEYRVSAPTFEYPSSASVAMNPSGDFVVAWQSQVEYGSLQFRTVAQRFDNEATPQGANFQVNSTVGYWPKAPAPAVDDLGRFVVVWKNAYQDGSGDGIFARRFSNLSCAAPLGAVTDFDLRLIKVDGINRIQYNWTNVPGAEEYVVYYNGAANGNFYNFVTQGTDGTLGTTGPAYPGTFFYLIAARSTLCGEGPLH